MNESERNIVELFKNAENEFEFSEETGDVLRKSNVAERLAQQGGLSSQESKANELILVGVMPDDSSSIRDAGNTQDVIDGHNEVIKALKGAKKLQSEAILFRTQYLNGNVLNNWVRLKQAREMNTKNFTPHGWTPLYDNAVLLLGSLHAEVQQASEKGKTARSGILIVSDGMDQGSKHNTADDVRTMVNDMLSENTSQYTVHTVAFMGIGHDEGYFRSIAESMGIVGKWVITPGSDAQKIRRAFETFSEKFGNELGGGF